MPDRKFVPADCHPTKRRAARTGLCSSCHQRERRKTDPKFREDQLRRSREWYGRNKEYNNQRALNWQARNKSRARWLVKRSNWVRKGMDADEAEAFYMNFNGYCGCCNDPLKIEDAHMDHNHDTGKVRSVLCHRCNVGLGMFQENVDKLKRAIAYLEEHNE